MNRKEKLIQVVFSLLAIGFLFIPFYSAFINGLLRWHISQPRLWKDAIELMMYVLVIVIISFLARNKKGIVVLLVGGAYLLSAGTLQECLVSYIYIEIILLIGRSCLALLTNTQKKYSAGVQFLVGSLVWGFFAIIMSFLKLGTINDLRILTLILLLTAVINPKYKINCYDVLLVRYVKYINGIKKNEFGINLFFIIIMLISCVRVNNYIDYDSTWYCLYTDKNLFGENSFYDYLGYTEFVHYYPKFKELLLAPISGLGMAGYLVAPNLWIMLLCMVEVYDFLIDNIKENRSLILGIVYLIFSTMCIIGVSSTAKSDTLSYLYILLLIIYFIKYIKMKEQFLLCIAISAGAMSYTVKYTSFLFSTVIFICIFATMAYLLVTKKIKVARFDILSVMIVIFAGFILFGIIYRTFKLTGYPTYRAGISVWKALGFSGKPYFGEPDVGVSVPHLSRIFSWFFDVNATGKHPLWIGNYSLFFSVCCLLMCKNKSKNEHKFMLIITVLLAIISLYYLVMQRSPDGNYFSVAVIMVTCYSFIRMSESRNWIGHKRCISIWMILFMSLNLLFLFVIHPSWCAGTKFTVEPILPWISEQTKLEKREDSMKALGIYEINEELKNSTDGQDLIIADGVNEANSPEVLMNMLDARVDTAGMVFHNLFSGAKIENYQDFLEYVDYVGVDGFIIEQEGSQYPMFVEYVKQYISENGCIRQVDTNKYSYYKIR